eukprot:gene28888-32332_t
MCLNRPQAVGLFLLRVAAGHRIPAASRRDLWLTAEWLYGRAGFAAIRTASRSRRHLARPRPGIARTTHSPLASCRRLRDPSTLPAA